jgi:hypothetical protein
MNALPHQYRLQRHFVPDGASGFNCLRMHVVSRIFRQMALLSLAAKVVKVVACCRGGE